MQQSKVEGMSKYGGLVTGYDGERGQSYFHPYILAIGVGSTFILEDRTPKTTVLKLAL